MPRELFPVKNVAIQGATARIITAIQTPQEQQVIMPVRDAIEIDKALGDPGNSHRCPLCYDFFGTEAFVAHAQQCIDIHAPRKHTFTPPGFSDNAVVHYKDKIKPDFVIESERIQAENKRENQ